MTRNMDLIREILLEVEKVPYDGRFRTIVNLARQAVLG
jgi:hypothetical protein